MHIKAWEGLCVCALSHFNSWDLMNCSPPNSSFHGILQARILEWVAVSSSSGSSSPKDQTPISWIPCFGRQIIYHWAIWEAINLRGPHKHAGLHQTTKNLHSKWNFQWNKMATYGMGENTCKQYSWEWFNIWNRQIIHRTIYNNYFLRHNFKTISRLWDILCQLLISC